jgi:hypothetical protein
MDPNPYSVVDVDNRIIAAGLSSDKLVSDTSFFRYFVPTKGKPTEFFRAPSSRINHMESPGEYYYYRTDKGLGICKIWDDFGQIGLDMICPASEFVHYSEANDITYTLNAGQLIFSTADTTIAVNRNTKLLYTADGNYEVGFWETLESVNDTTKTLLYKNQIDNQTVQKERALISVGDTQLYIDNSRYINDEQYYFDEIWGNEYNISFRCDSEASSVWRWDGARWQKKSPYYAGLEQIPGGFIARSGYLDENTLDYSPIQYDGEPIPIHNEIPERYFLLNENLEARFYVDWLDFPKIENYGFGVAVWLIDKALFVDYSGKPITDAEWHRFELVDGKLKAIRDEIIVYDEWGNEMLDENGNVMKFSEAGEKYFELK